jgi:hypothetical protein
VDVRWLEEKWISHKGMNEQAQKFIDRAFSVPPDQGVKCPCNMRTRGC